MIKIKSLASSSKGNYYHITDGKTPLLIECGISIKRIREALNFGLSDVCGCLVSHAHLDHSKSANKIMDSGIDCYMSSQTGNSLNISGHRFKIIETSKKNDLRPFKIGTWAILAFNTIHDADGSVSYFLQSHKGNVLFLTDSAYFEFQLPGITHLMIECNYQKDILNENIKNGSISVTQKNRLLFSHFSLENVIEFLKANDLSKLKEIHLLHLSSGNSNAQEMKETVQRITGKPTYICEE